jgi:hypothetical protein
VLVRVGPLPLSAVAAAGRFHAEVLPALVEELGASEQLLIVFEPADHAHRAWRLAVVQGLAREHAPVRVNAVASSDEAAIRAAADYLARAPGVTGQYFALDGDGAGGPIP